MSRGGSPGRGRVIRANKNKGLEGWKKEVHYLKRRKVEIFFSLLKKKMGEVIMANRLVYQI